MLKPDALKRIPKSFAASACQGLNGQFPGTINSD
jgi:hypothetical protein